MENDDSIEITVRKIGNGYLVDATKRCGGDYRRVSADTVYQADIDTIKALLPAILDQTIALDFKDGDDADSIPY